MRGLMSTSTYVVWILALLVCSMQPLHAEESRSPVSPPTEDESPAAWCKRAATAYAEASEGAERGAIALQVAQIANHDGYRPLLTWFNKERNPAARAGIEEALVSLGGPKLAKDMGKALRRPREPMRASARRIVFACLRKPETEEPEEPFCMAVREAHRARDFDYSRELMMSLRGLGRSGARAMAEVLFEKDFGLHDECILFIEVTEDPRVVPALLHGLTRPYGGSGSSAANVRKNEPLTRRRNAIKSIGWWGVPALIESMGNKKSHRSDWADRCLREITGEAVEDRRRLRTAWQRWWTAKKQFHPDVVARWEARDY